MGLPWIELHTELPDHPKSLALAEALSDDRAWTYMAQLWLYCARNAPDGLIKGVHAVATVERAAGWKGARGKLYEAARDAGFLKAGETGEPSTLIVVYGWAERASAHIAKLERDSERQKERRARVASRFGPRQKADAQTASAGCPPNVHATSTGRPSDVTRMSPGTVTPTPTPTQTKDSSSRPPPPTASIRVVEKPTSSPDGWVGGDFFRWAQWLRQRSKLIPENEPKGLGAWWSGCLMTPGVDAHAMKRGFERFGKDEHWDKANPPHPFRAFMTEWPKYVRAEAEHAVGI